jgi:hypothetical protein
VNSVLLQLQTGCVLTPLFAHMTTLTPGIHTLTHTLTPCIPTSTLSPPVSLRVDRYSLSSCSSKSVSLCGGSALRWADLAQEVLPTRCKSSELYT